MAKILHYLQSRYTGSQHTIKYTILTMAKAECYLQQLQHTQLCSSDTRINHFHEKELLKNVFPPETEETNFTKLISLINRQQHFFHIEIYIYTFFPTKTKSQNIIKIIKQSRPRCKQI